MELNLSSSAEEFQFKKHFFNLKNPQSDGLILQIHHSYSGSSGENKRYRFIHASFSDSGTHLAVADHKGHIFIIDLETQKYWQLSNFGLPTVISFPVLKKHDLLISLDTCFILIIHIETGNTIGVLKGHSSPPTEVSYSDDGNYYLTYCTSEAIIWNSLAYTQIHRLSLKPEASLKKLFFMPVTNHILACFQDDTMLVWKFGSFDCIKQIIPETWKSHHLKAIALTKNGRAMVIGGHTPNLICFCLDTWVVIKIVEFPEHISGVKQMEFLSEVFDGGANKILVLLTTSLEIYFFDIESSTFLKGIHCISGMTAKFALSCNGKYVASILTSGEVNIYMTEKIFSNTKHLTESYEDQTAVRKTSSNFLTSRNYSNTSRKSQKFNDSLCSIQRQLKDVLDVKKLQPILQQFNEYPESYRLLIWKTILQLPANQESYISLSTKKCHPSYINLEAKFPMVNKSLCNSLKKLLSNLSHWCPLFGEVDFLPEFVFPFLKLFHSDPLACFELVATIIVNWCQNWFEFYPFPPVNMLSMMENILGYHDSVLLEFYIKNNITSSIFVCPLFHTAFSEVLSKTEWLKFWDHVLSNEPSFLFMAIVAYNIICRNAIKTFQNPAELEMFFHKQNPVDMKMLISKTDHYLKETPEEIHCRQFFLPFRPLSSGGTYTSFVAYPKLIIDSNAEKLKSIRKEEEEILEEQFKALKIMNKLDKKLKSDSKTESQERIYQELEEKIRKLVEEEEDRVLTQRQKLQNLRQELRLKELEVLETTRDKALKERLKRKKNEFERLLKDISKRKAREKMEVDVMEEEIQKYYSELLLRKCQLEMELGVKDNEEETSTNLDILRQKLKTDLMGLQNNWSSLYHSKCINYSNKIAVIKALMHDLETEVAKENSEKTLKKQSQEDQIFIEDLKNKVKCLEDEIENLLKDNLSRLQRKSEDKEIKPQLSSEKLKMKSFRKSKFPESKIYYKSAGPNIEYSNLNENNKRKKLKNSKTQKSLKTISKAVSPGVRKVTTVRTKVSRTKLKDSSGVIKTKNNLSKKESTKSMHDFEVGKSVIGPKHYKSKFTCPSQHMEPATDCPETNSKSYRSGTESRNSDLYYEARKLHHQPKGDVFEDSVGTTKITSNTGKGNQVKFIAQDVSSDETDSDNEIFKSALKARKQIIEKAKMRQRLD